MLRIIRAKNPFEEENYWLPPVEAIRGFLAGNADGRDFLESALSTSFTSCAIFDANDNPNFVGVSKIAARNSQELY
ncbi:TPA: hypothetical protein ACPSKB_001951 [Legionella feeleii]|uniref:hypothetical protein n=1 Tax=Legionella feeleii TaxID=453 RepID=UPI000E0FE0A4|nr:hypothetical protein [Legionella feeleii]